MYSYLHPRISHHSLSDLPQLSYCIHYILRVKKISEQSVAEAAVRMLENDTLEVPSPSTEKYKLSAIQNGEKRLYFIWCYKHYMLDMALVNA